MKTRNPASAELFYAERPHVQSLSEFAEWISDQHVWSDFEAEWGEFIPDIFTAIQSLTHRSFYNENQVLCVGHNERLEFLGDAILDAIIVTELFLRLPEESEGILSRLKNTLVNENFLGELSRFIGLNHLILVGKGELSNNGLGRDSILSDAFEAFLAGIYICHGQQKARAFVLKAVELYQEIKNIKLFDPVILDSFDAKSRLQEKVMKVFKRPPRYISEDLAENENTYRVKLMVEDKEILFLEGNSKKKLEQRLAYEVLHKDLLNQYFSEEFSHVD